MPWQGRGNHLRGQAAVFAAVAYAATSVLLLAFNFKWSLFKCLSKHYPLTVPQDPRRNHYGPIVQLNHT